MGRWSAPDEKRARSDERAHRGPGRPCIGHNTSLLWLGSRTRRCHDGPRVGESTSTEVPFAWA
jgi:hypothetical protein